MSTTPDAVATFHLAAALRRYAADVSTLALLTSAARSSPTASTWEELTRARQHLEQSAARVDALRALVQGARTETPPPVPFGPAHPLWPVPRRPGVWRLRRPTHIPTIRAAGCALGRIVAAVRAWVRIREQTTVDAQPMRFVRIVGAGIVLQSLAMLVCAVLIHR